MKDATMNTNDTSSAVALPAELLRVGHQKLRQAQSKAMEHIGAEVAAIMPTRGTSTGCGPESLPAWAVRALTEAGMSGEQPLCWRTLREHLAQRTADLITGTKLADQITGGSLARFIGLDVYALAYDGWAEIERIGPTMSGSVK